MGIEVPTASALPSSAHAAPDRLTLYRWAVQDPEVHATVLHLMHAHLNDRNVDPDSPVDLARLASGGATGRPPTAARVLREDFAGTAADSVAWLALDPNPQSPGRRCAFGIDLDRATVDWAAARAARLLGPRASDLDLIEGDSVSLQPPRVPPADIIAALNFSVLYLREAADLDAYLTTCRGALNPGGILVMNTFGGCDATRPGITTTRITPKPRLRTEEAAPAFDYHWEVRSFDEHSARLDCRIHFAAPGATEPLAGCRDAFRYDWRLRSPGDLVQACQRAGFSRAQFWRHTFDPAREAQGLFLGPTPLEAVAHLSSWTGYIVAQAV